MSLASFSLSATILSETTDKLSPEAAFDEISKILFMKIRYEREQAKTKALFSRSEFEVLKQLTKNCWPRRYALLSALLSRKLKIFLKWTRNSTLMITLKFEKPAFYRLYQGVKRKYNLSDTSDDVKGIALKEFLGKTFRGELGQFFTPRTIVDYMVEVLDPQEGETLCDPCCGSGGFLIKAFEYVRNKIEVAVQHEKEKIKGQYFGAEYELLAEEKQEQVAERVDNLFAEAQLRARH